MNRREKWLAEEGARWVAATEPIRAFARTLHGLEEREAGAAAIERGCIWRVVMVDGVGLAGHLDRRPNRINAIVVDGVVVDSTIG